MPSRVSAVLLAAGSAQRMGRLKQLLPIGARPAVLCCIDALSAAGIEHPVVVLGPRSEMVRQLMPPTAVVVMNGEPSSEMAESVRIGIDAVPSATESVLICLADHPLIAAGTIAAVVRAGESSAGCIIIPRYGGRRGHPCLFPLGLLDGVRTGMNLREIIRSNADRIRFIDTTDEGVVLDMDTEEDYRRILERADRAAT